MSEPTSSAALVPHHVLKELYQNIYKVHWSYLELEDGMQKLEEQKVLESLLKKFLCLVPHNRKFFLPETFTVFKRTVTQQKEFSIVKMLNGFESISQYANNLFTKPWRKEYRTIKMYSGFFIHEIKSNLIDPEELFVAMGYKKMANHTLVLDGEICPDQVMNVSRDAMTAYTECKIMNKIYSELTTVLKMACTWQDVFAYREMHIGGVSDTIEAIRQVMQQHDRCFPRDQQMDLCFNSAQNGVSSLNSNSSCNNINSGLIGPSAAASTAMGLSHSNYNLNGNNCNQIMCNGSGHQMTMPASSTGPHYNSNSNHGYHNHHHQVATSSTASNAVPLDNYYHHNNGNVAQAPNGHCNLHPYGLTKPTGQPQQQLHQQGLRSCGQSATVGGICDYQTPSSGHHPSSLPHSKSLEHYGANGQLPAAGNTQLGSDLQHHNSIYNAQHRHSVDHAYDNYSRTGHYEAPLLNGSGHHPTHHHHHHHHPQDGGSGLMVDMPSGQPQHSSYNVSGTRYPLPYSISSQFANAPQQQPQPSQMMDWPKGHHNQAQHHYQQQQQPHHHHHHSQYDANGYDGYEPALSSTPAVATAHTVMTMPKRCDSFSTTTTTGPNGTLINGDCGGGGGHDRLIEFEYPYNSNANPNNNNNINNYNVSNGGSNSKRVAAGDGGISTSHYYSQLRPDSNFESSDDIDGRVPGMRPSSTMVGQKVRMIEQQHQTPRTSDFDSYEELFADQRKGRREKSKIQDGVGSFESWDYVYQSLDQQDRQPVPQDRSRTMSRPEAVKIQDQISTLRAMKSQEGEEEEVVGVRGSRRPSASNAVHQKSLSLGRNGPEVNNHQRQLSDSVTTSRGGDSFKTRTMGPSSAAAGNKKGHVTRRSEVATASIVATNASEWSCRFCTFLNPNSRRICEMCAKSKDFNLDTGNAPTCV